MLIPSGCLHGFLKGLKKDGRGNRLSEKKSDDSIGYKVIEDTIQQHVRKERSAVLLVLSNFSYRIHHVLSFVNFYFKKLHHIFREAGVSILQWNIESFVQKKVHESG